MRKAAKNSTIIVSTMVTSLLVLILQVAVLNFNPFVTASSDKDTSWLDPCPTGSYSIGTDKQGQHICKAEPTGCPYGDSIPMNMCDKFKPVKKSKTIKKSVVKPVYSKPQAPSCGK